MVIQVFSISYASKMTTLTYLQCYSVTWQQLQEEFEDTKVIMGNSGILILHIFLPTLTVNKIETIIFILLIKCYFHDFFKKCVVYHTNGATLLQLT
jgi:hypothetical protein